MATKQQQLDDLRAKILKDQVCPELAKTATQLVFGVGDPDSDIMFVGEAPGKNEDEQGKPFVGAAGHFLDEMLAMINLKRENVYITNIVKYRPPNNRDPLPDEKQVFMPYLQAQIDIIQPKIVVALGNHSLSCFLPELRISQCHGQPKRIHIGLSPLVESAASGKKKIPAPKDSSLPVVILPLFHPAAALYNGGLRQTLIDDFAKIPQVLKQIASAA
jgi:uracil-DNA glycosylase family 4